MLKDAPHRLSAAFPVITMGQMVRHTGLSPKKIIFLRVDYLEKCQCAHFCCQNHCFGLLGAYQAASACPSQDFNYSLSLHYDTDCWNDGGKPSKNFFSELIVFKNANLHIFGLAITVFANFESLGKLIEAPHGTSTTFSVFSMTSTVGSLGTSPQKKCFFQSWLPSKMLILCNFGLNIKVLAFFWAYQAANTCPSQDLHCSLSLHYDPDCWTDGGKPLKDFVFIVDYI